MEKIINKTMDRQDLETGPAKIIIEELNDLIKEFTHRKLYISSWYGKELTSNDKSPENWNRGYNYTPLNNSSDDDNFPWFLYWEIVWIVLNNEFKAGQTVLDLGGSSSLFSFYLASKGINVTTIDIQQRLVDNANHVVNEMNYNMKNYVMDMRELNLTEKYDHVVSICVYEHIPLYERVEINKNIKEVLVPGGKFSLTFDYRNPSLGARINSPLDIHDQFIKPSGLLMRGNHEFYDNGKNYLLTPFFHKNATWIYRLYSAKSGYCGLFDMFKTKVANDYTFAALFLKKQENDEQNHDYQGRLF